MAELWLFLVALSVAYLLPGPDMILLLQTGARQGRRAALATVLGLAVARACHVTLAAVGLATLFKVLPWTFEVVKYTGAAYLLWLGVKMFRPVAGAVQGPGGAAVRGTWRAAIAQGFLTNLLNPKALLFCSVLLPQFIDPQAGPVAAQFALLGVILVAVGFAFDCCYALAGARIGRWLASNRSAQRLQQWLFGSLLIGFAVRLTFVQHA